jgi:cytoskeletal protein CcmA (bactofilin family)
MTNRIPLIVNAVAEQVQELSADDNLSLGGSDLVDANVVTANTISVISSTVSGDATVSGNLTVSGVISGVLSTGPNGLLMSVIFGR